MRNSILECETITYQNHHFPWHLHPTCSTFSHVLSGKGLLIFSDTKLLLEEGMTVYIPPGVPHQAIVPDEMTYRVIRVEAEQLTLCQQYQQNYWVWSSKAIREVFCAWFSQLQQGCKKQSKHDQNISIPAFFRKSNFVQKPLTQADDAITKVVAHLHLTYDENLVLDDLCQLAQQSNSHFRRTFKKRTGISPMKYLLSLRIDKSKALIRDGLLLTEVAHATGFYDQSHFNKYFRILSGMNPTAYRTIIEK